MKHRLGRGAAMAAGAVALSLFILLCMLFYGKQDYLSPERILARGDALRFRIASIFVEPFGAGAYLAFGLLFAWSIVAYFRESVGSILPQVVGVAACIPSFCALTSLVSSPHEFWAGSVGVWTGDIVHRGFGPVLGVGVLATLFLVSFAMATQFGFYAQFASLRGSLSFPLLPPEEGGTAVLEPGEAAPVESWQTAEASVEPIEPPAEEADEFSDASLLDREEHVADIRRRLTSGEPVTEAEQKLVVDAADQDAVGDAINSLFAPEAPAPAPAAPVLSLPEVPPFLLASAAPTLLSQQIAADGPALAPASAQASVPAPTAADLDAVPVPPAGPIKLETEEFDAIDGPTLVQERAPHIFASVEFLPPNEELADPYAEAEAAAAPAEASAVPEIEPETQPIPTTLPAATPEVTPSTYQDEFFAFGFEDEAPAAVTEEPTPVEASATVAVVETPVVETPVAVVETPVVETPVAVVETPVVETPVAIVETPVVETPVAVVETPVVETPVAVVETPVVIETPAAPAPVEEDHGSASSIVMSAPVEEVAPAEVPAPIFTTAAPVVAPEAPAPVILPESAADAHGAAVESVFAAPALDDGAWLLAASKDLGLEKVEEEPVPYAFPALEPTPDQEPHTETNPCIEVHPFEVLPPSDSHTDDVLARLFGDPVVRTDIDTATPGPAQSEPREPPANLMPVIEEVAERVTLLTDPVVSDCLTDHGIDLATMQVVEVPQEDFVVDDDSPSTEDLSNEEAADGIIASLANLFSEPAVEETPAPVEAQTPLYPLEAHGWGSLFPSMLTEGVEAAADDHRVPDDGSRVPVHAPPPAAEVASIEEILPVETFDVPAPVEFIEEPTPAEIVGASAPVEVVETPAPVAVVETPAPVEVVETPAPVEVVEAPAPVESVESSSPATESFEVQAVEFEDSVVEESVPAPAPVEEEVEEKLDEALLSRLVEDLKSDAPAAPVEETPVEIVPTVVLPEEPAAPAKREGRDELYDTAIAAVRERGRGSVVVLQRKLGIGFTRATRIIEELVSDGILGAENSSGSHPIL